MNTHSLFEEPVVEIVSGKIRGATSANGCHFKGIPYAGTTEGAQRFLPPSPTPSPGCMPRKSYAARPRAPPTPSPLSRYAVEGLIATGCNDCGLRLWDIATGKLVDQSKKHGARVNACTWNSDGTQVRRPRHAQPT